jgi:hypothetical protein
MGWRQHPERGREALDHLIRSFDPDRRMQQQQGPATPALDELDAGSRDLGKIVVGF